MRRNRRRGGKDGAMCCGRRKRWRAKETSRISSTLKGSRFIAWEKPGQRRQFFRKPSRNIRKSEGCISRFHRQFSGCAEGKTGKGKEKHVSFRKRRQGRVYFFISPLTISPSATS